MPRSTSSDAEFTILVGGEQLETMRLVRLYRDWTRAMRGAEPPAGDFLDAQPYDYLAGARLIFDVERDGERLRYRYRHIDPQILAYSPRDMTGLYLDQHDEAYYAERATRALDLVVETRRPIHARVHRVVNDQAFLMEYLMLPLAGPDGAVSALFGAQLFMPTTS